MNKREKFIAVITVSVILIWVIQTLSRSRSHPMKPLAAGSGMSLPAESGEKIDTEQLVEHMLLRRVSLNIEETGDPFERIDQRQSVQAGEAVFSDLTLQGIFWEQETPVVLINDLILKEGESVLGFDVLVIKKEEVIVGKGAERYIMRIYKEQDGNLKQE